MKKIPITFISYSWDSSEHYAWVLKLSNYLINLGRVDVILEQHELSAGKNLIHFKEHIEKADKVIVVMTPEYKRKAENRERGVGFEYTFRIAHLIITNIFS